MVIGLEHLKVIEYIKLIKIKQGAVWSAKLNRNATLALTGSADFTCILWDSINGNIKNTFEHKHIVRDVVFSKVFYYYNNKQTEKLIATGGKEKKFRLFDINNAKDPINCFDVSGDITHISTYTVHSYLITYNENLCLYDVKSNKVQNTIKFDKNISDLELLFSGDIITIAVGNSVKFYDSKELKLIKEYNYSFDIYSASLRPDKKRFIFGGEDTRVYECEFEDGKEISNVGGHFGKINCVKYHPKGDKYVSGSDDSSIRMWKYPEQKKYEYCI